MVPWLKQPTNKAARKQRKALDLAFDWSSEKGGADLLARLVPMLMTTIAVCFGACCMQLRAVEIVLDEMAEQFDGVDPLRPRIRETLTGIRQKLLTQKEHLEYLSVECELPEAEEEDLDLLRLLMTNAKRLY